MRRILLTSNIKCSLLVILKHLLLSGAGGVGLPPSGFLGEIGSWEIIRIPDPGFSGTDSRWARWVRGLSVHAQGRSGSPVAGERWAVWAYMVYIV